MSDRRQPIGKRVESKTQFAVVRPLAYALVFVALLFASQFASTQAVSGDQASIPKMPDRIELRGPITEVTDDGWIIAGTITVKRNADVTRVNERVEEPDAGKWVRVVGVPDCEGGIQAWRVKTIGAQHFVRLWGQLGDLDPEAGFVEVGGDGTETCAGVVVDFTGQSPRITGKSIGSEIVPGTRVDVRAEWNETDGLQVRQIVVKGGPADDDSSDDDVDEKKFEEPDEGNPGDIVEIVGVLQDPNETLSVAQTDPLLISGVPVAVGPTTEVRKYVNNLIAGAWVKAKGTVDENGVLQAYRLATTHSREYVEIEGPLFDLTDEQLSVGGIVIALTDTSEIDESCTVGQHVEVEAIQNDTGALEVVEAECGDDRGPDDHGQDKNGNARPGIEDDEEDSSDVVVDDDEDDGDEEEEEDDDESSKGKGQDKDKGNSKDKDKDDK